MVRRVGGVEPKPGLLVFPPLEPKCYTHIYPSLPVLAAALEAGGHATVQLELNNEMILWYLTSDLFRRELETAARQVRECERKQRLTDAAWERYLQCRRLLLLARHLKKVQRPRDLQSVALLFAELGRLGANLPEKINPYLSSTSRCFDALAKLAVITRKRLPRAGPYAPVLRFYEHYFSTQRVPRPLFVGVSVAMPAQVIPAILLAQWLKRRVWEEVPIFFGGATLSLMSDRALSALIDDGGLAGIVVGEGEEAVVQIADQLARGSFDPQAVANLVHRKTGKFRRSPTLPRKKLDDYPAPLHDPKTLKKWKPEYISVIAGRGCYWGKCAYCTFPLLYGRRLVKTPERILADMEWLWEKYGARNFLLECDTTSPAHIRRLCRLMIARGFTPRWNCYVRVDRGYRPEDFALMKKAGCAFAVVGLESLDDRTLKLMTKGYTEKEARRFLGRFLAAGVDTRIDMIIDFPGTDFNAAKRQHELLAKLMLRAARRGTDCRVLTFRLVVFGCAPLGTRPAACGLRVRRRSRDNYLAQCVGLPFVDRQGMTDDEKQRIETLYRKLNDQIALAAAPKPRRASGAADGLLVSCSSTATCGPILFGDDKARLSAPDAMVFNSNDGSFTRVRDYAMARRTINILKVEKRSSEVVRELCATSLQTLGEKGAKALIAGMLTAGLIGETANPT